MPKGKVVRIAPEQRQKLIQTLRDPKGRQKIFSRIGPIDLKRPFRMNPDGTRSTEITQTFRLSDGGWVSLPTIFGDRDLSEQEIMQQAPTFPKFQTMEEAVEAAKLRSVVIDILRNQQ